MSASQGSAVLQAVYGSTTIQKIYNISKSIAGANGTNGTRTAILDMYLWSASTPTVFPSGTSTYTWATGQFTAPATTNGWSLTPPAAVLGQTLYIARTIYADTGTSSTSSVTWTATTATSISASGSNGSNGTNGTNGSNGYRTAFLEVYQWNNTTPTSFPSGTSIYTWSNGSFTAPATLNGWSLTPGASTPGYSLYACSVTYADTNTSSTSSVTWSTSTAYVVGYSGVNGSTGATGATGSAGSATFLVTRTANDSSPPTNAETNTAIGRNPVAGDIVTVSYNSANNAVVYRYTTSWVTQATYLTGSLIVDGTITASKLSVSQLSAITANLGTVTAGDLAIGTTPAISGTSMTGTGAHIYSDGRMVVGNSSQNIVWDNSNLTINGNIVSYGNINGTAVGQIIAGSFNFVTKTTTGSGTFVVPTNVYKLKVTCIGGGGSGGTGSSYGGGGGAGGCIKVFAVTPGASYSYFVGAGGTGGGNGQDTTFTGTGVSMTAGKGFGGAFVNGGAGGTATGGDLNISGQSGGNGTLDPYGGYAPFIGVGGSYNGGAASTNSGGGGAALGGAGGSGLIIIEY
jgi:hypothetical protein